MKGRSTPEMDNTKIHIIKKQCVDEFHPTVQKLIVVGYSVKRSIEAVERHEGLEEAMDYLLQSTTEEGIFQVSASNEEYWPQEMELLVDSQQERVT